MQLNRAAIWVLRVLQVFFSINSNKINCSVLLPHLNKNVNRVKQSDKIFNYILFSCMYAADRLHFIHDGQSVLSAVRNIELDHRNTVSLLSNYD